MAEGDLADELRRLEERLLDAAPTDLEALLADDFVEIGKSGRVYAKADVVRAFAGGEPAKGARTLHDFAVRALAPGIALATYRVVESGRASLRSSIWQGDGDRWPIVFHQGTPEVTPSE